MFSLQDVVRILLPQKIPASAPLQLIDWIVAGAGFFLFVALYWLFVRIFFRAINRDYAKARQGAWVMSTTLGFTWALAILEIPFGPLTTAIVFSVAVFVLFIDFLFLFLTRP